MNNKNKSYLLLDILKLYNTLEKEKRFKYNRIQDGAESNSERLSKVWAENRYIAKRWQMTNDEKKNQKIKLYIYKNKSQCFSDFLGHYFMP